MVQSKLFKSIVYSVMMMSMQAHNSLAQDNSKYFNELNTSVQFRIFDSWKKNIEKNFEELKKDMDKKHSDVILALEAVLKDTHKLEGKVIKIHDQLDSIQDTLEDLVSSDSHNEHLLENVIYKFNELVNILSNELHN